VRPVLVHHFRTLDPWEQPGVMFEVRQDPPHSFHVTLEESHSSPAIAARPAFNSRNLILEDDLAAMETGEIIL
ncbi:MAG TPA: hypothetical protein VJO34_02195, partial [Methylomirabilota bacterium]|nr:hypothetical protein [Methylomirabilota bacterium]